MTDISAIYIGLKELVTVLCARKLLTPFSVNPAQYIPLTSYYACCV